MKISRIVFGIICFLVIQTSGVIAAQSQIALILWHDLNWEDFQASDFFERDDVAIGTMNTRVGGGHGIAASYLTLASGARAFGTVNSGKLFHGSELYLGSLAQELYRLHTGIPVSYSQIVHPEINQMLAASAAASYPLEIGFLAKKIKDANLKIGAFGNSDLRDQAVRWGGLVAMDHQGIVDHGYIGSELILEDSDYPYEKRTDYPQLLERVIASDLDLVIIDLGDPYRFSAYQQYLVPEQLQSIRARMVSEAWEFINELNLALPEMQLIILAPYADEEKAASGRWFAPVVMVGSSNSGLLTSSTTRWPGIVTNIDIAPTLLQSLGLAKGTMLGRPIELINTSTAEAMETIESLEQRVFWLGNYRSKVLRALVGFQIFLYLLTIVLLIIPKRFSDWFIKLVQYCLIVSLALPLILLVLSHSWLLLLAILSLISLAYYRWPHQRLTIIMIVSLATALLLTLDILRGSWWMRFSFLGYDPLGGARYYGIGNEYMGILIGSLILGWSILRGSLKQKKLWWLDLGLFSIISVIIAAPQLGTNVGGMIAALAGFGITIIGLNKVKVRLRTVVLLSIVILVALGGITLLDYYRPEAQQSHIGQTGQLIYEGGFTAIYQIIVRKLNMNLRLFRYSIWSRGLIVALIAMGASLIWPSKYLSWLMKEHFYLVQGIIGVLVGAIVALIFNDSGVVAAATCSFFAATTMLCLALNLKHDLLTAQSNIEQDTDSD